MGFRSWFVSRLAETDVTNLAVIVVFATLLGAASIAGLRNDEPGTGATRPLSDTGPPLGPADDGEERDGSGRSGDDDERDGNDRDDGKGDRRDGKGTDGDG